MKYQYFPLRLHLFFRFLVKRDEKKISKGHSIIGRAKVGVVFIKDREYISKLELFELNIDI